MEFEFKRKVEFSLVFLLIIFAIFIVLIHITKSYKVLLSLNFAIVFFAVFSFMISIAFWNVPLYIILREKNRIALKDVITAAFSSCYASLTPMQFGTDVMKAYLLRKKVPISETIAASMLLKSFKFAVLLILAIFASFYVRSEQLKPYFYLGFTIIFAIILFFSFPAKFKPKIKIAKISRIISAYPELNLKIALCIILFSSMAWFFEFFTFFLSVFSVYEVEFGTAFMIFVILAVLERTPLAPRGFLLIELVMFLYFKNKLPIQKIVAIITVYDFARVVFPAMLSIFLFSTFKILKAKKYNSKRL